MTIKEYADTLTPEEREQFKDLINECAEREGQLQRNSAEIGVSLSMLEATQRRLKTDLTELNSKLETLRDRLGETYLRVMVPPTTTH